MSAAHASFASGFAAALGLAALIAASIAAGVWLLAGASDAERVRGAASNG
jgi:hypothetical protein